MWVIAALLPRWPSRSIVVVLTEEQEVQQQQQEGCLLRFIHSAAAVSESSSSVITDSGHQEGLSSGSATVQPTVPFAAQIVVHNVTVVR